MYLRSEDLDLLGLIMEDYNECLIEAVTEKELLWNPNHADYKNKDQKWKHQTKSF